MTATLKLNEVVESVKDKLSNPPNIAPETYIRMVTEAIQFYSKFKPDTAVEDIDGNGTYIYSLPTGFVVGFSSILGLEYPLESTPEQYPTEWEENKDFDYYQTPSGWRLKFLTITPAAGKKFRVTYSLPHTVTVTSTTVPDADGVAIVSLCAAKLAETIAADWAHKSKSTMPDAMIDLRSKGQELETLADRFRIEWMDSMGLSRDGKPKAASLQKDTDWFLSDRGGYGLTHPRSTQ